MRVLLTGNWTDRAASISLVERVFNEQLQAAVLEVDDQGERTCGVECPSYVYSSAVAVVVVVISSRATSPHHPTDLQLHQHGDLVGSVTVRTLQLRLRCRWFDSLLDRCQVISTWMGGCLRTGKPF